MGGPSQFHSYCTAHCNAHWALLAARLCSKPAASAQKAQRQRGSLCSLGSLWGAGCILLGASRMPFLVGAFRMGALFGCFLFWVLFLGAFYSGCFIWVLYLGAFKSTRVLYYHSRKSTRYWVLFHKKHPLGAFLGAFFGCFFYFVSLCTQKPHFGE